MALETEIQRVPAGLANVLNLFGGILPVNLATQVIGNIDLLQFYGLSQRTVDGASNAALPPNTNLTVQLPPKWCVLYSASFTAVITAATTKLSNILAINRGTPSGPVYAQREYTQFGVAGNCTLPFAPPYPLLLPPSTTIVGAMDLLGVSATLSCSLIVEYGLFG